VSGLAEWAAGNVLATWLVTCGWVVSAEASELVNIPRTELDALKAELKRLRREVGRGVAKGYIEADPGPADDAPTFTREELAEPWGRRE
jgi:hypothetical protein